MSQEHLQINGYISSDQSIEDLDSPYIINDIKEESDSDETETPTYYYVVQPVVEENEENDLLSITDGNYASHLSSNLNQAVRNTCQEGVATYQCDTSESSESHHECNAESPTEHMRTQSYEKPAFYALNEHERTHTVERQFSCKVCDKQFKSIKERNSHRKIHTDGERVHSCTVCTMTFVTLVKLKEHMRTHTDEKPHDCSFNEKHCTLSQPCDRHRKDTPTKEQHFTCDMCAEVFASLRSVNMHKRVHNIKRSLSCSVCSKSFRILSLLVAHLRTHTGEKPYSCPLCGKRFGCPGHCRRHERTHSKARPFKCDQCTMCFTTFNKLLAHMRVHTDNKPHACGICEKRFTTSSNCRKHQKTHNQTEASVIVPSD